VVVNLGETAVGIIVDTVNEVLSIPAGEVSPPPRVREGSRFVRGMGKVGEAVKILLDLNKLLSDSEIVAARLAPQRWNGSPSPTRCRRFNRSR
jgi:purine-binding chemotaxis protein CheW